MLSSQLYDGSISLAFAFFADQKCRKNKPRICGCVAECNGCFSFTYLRQKPRMRHFNWSCSPSENSPHEVILVQINGSGS